MQRPGTVAERSGVQDSPPSNAGSRADTVSDWCDKHWAPFRDNPTIYNGLQAAVLMMQRLVADGPFQEMCGFNPATGQKAKTENLARCKQMISPVCCYLGDKVMAEILQQCRK